MSRFAIVALTLASLAGWRPAVAADSGSLSMVVMDPLAAPLSCPCVEGYAQRDYEVLAEHLESALGRTVQVTFAESLATAVQKSGRPADIVIGKQSVVHSDATKMDLDMSPICRLTDLKGSTDQFGMIVVHRDDPARSAEDLSGYTIFFGPAEAEEKHSAALQLLSEAGISVTAERQKISPACSDGACKVVDMGPESRAAAVISSYAQPLLEGCGTIKKGDLRVLAKTKPVPFVTLFAAEAFDRDELAKLRTALSTVAVEPTVLEALESLVGFLPIEDSDAKKKAKS